VPAVVAEGLVEEAAKLVAKPASVPVFVPDPWFDEVAAFTLPWALLHTVLARLTDPAVSEP
jgi:hypothetical protein